MTQETPTRPPIRRSIRHLCIDYHGVADDLLVATVHHETGAAPGTIRATIERMERTGAIYNATGSHRRPYWRVTAL